MREKKKLVVILGQTATGKSDYAVKIAKIINGEIISADSRQIYKGLDIGTGKIKKEEMEGIPHHLLDVADPKSDKRYTAMDWVKDASMGIKKIWESKKIPVICGGTGFYISALLEEINISDVKPDLSLRNKLQEMEIPLLIKILENLPLYKEEKKKGLIIDLNNKIKIIRAIEIYKDQENKTEQSEADNSTNSIDNLNKNDYEVYKIGLTLEEDILKDKIRKRIEKRIDEGMIEEAVRLHREGLSLNRMKELGLEYKYLAIYIENNLDIDKLKKVLMTKIWQYARRQKIWFKRFKDIHWIDPIKTDNNDILSELSAFIQK